MGHISKAYVAGLFDGEGCVDICRNRRYWALRAKITNTDIDTLKRIQAIFGGALHVVGKCPSRPEHWKPLGHLVWRGHRARWFLKMIKPHIWIKKRELDLALEFAHFTYVPKKKRCDVSWGIGSNGKRSGRLILRPDVIATMEDYQQRLSRLKHP